MRSRWVAMAGLGTLLVPAMVWAQGGSGDPATNWAAIVQCTAIDEAEARHDCMDDVARRAGLLSEVRTEQAARREFGSEDLPPPPRPAPVRTEAPRVAAAPPVRAEDIQELVTTIAAVRTVGYRRLRVTTAEGSVWDQTQAETFTREPRVGDAFTIVRGSLGGYRCQFRELSRYPCERVG